MDRDSGFAAAGFTLTQDAAFGKAVDDIIARFKQKKFFSDNTDTLACWAHNFGFGNDTVRDHLSTLEPPCYLAGCTWAKQHNTPGMKTMFNTNPSRDLGTIVVYGFSSGTTFQTERGSHLRKTRVTNVTPSTSKMIGDEIAAEDPSLDVHRDDIDKDSIETHIWKEGGRMIAHPLLHWRLDEGSVIAFTYVHDPGRRDGFVFSPELKEIVQGLERDGFKIHKTFKGAKENSPDKTAIASAPPSNP